MHRKLKHKQLEVSRNSVYIKWINLQEKNNNSNSRNCKDKYKELLHLGILWTVIVRKHDKEIDNKDTRTNKCKSQHTHLQQYSSSTKCWEVLWWYNPYALKGILFSPVMILLTWIVSTVIERVWYATLSIKTNFGEKDIISHYSWEISPSMRW